MRMVCADGQQDLSTHLPAASHKDWETQGSEQTLKELGMEKLTAPNRYKKVYLWRDRT